MKVFALNTSRHFGELVARNLGISLSEHEETDFEDGEHKSRPLENVRNQDVFVIQSLHSDEKSVNDKLCRLLFFLSALKDASARRVTAVVPYLCYARKDRKNEPRDPVTISYIARLFETAGTDCILTIDVHNISAFQNAFRCCKEHLEAKKLFADFLTPMLLNDEAIAVMSPDIGGIKRAEQFQRSLSKRLQKESPLVFMEKYRSDGGLSGEKVAGDVKDKTVVIIDDLISTGKTLVRAASYCKRSGAKKVLALATHGVFSAEAGKAMSEDSLQQIIITNTIPPFRLKDSPANEKITVLDVAPLFAEAIKQMYEGGSVSGLLHD